MLDGRLGLPTDHTRYRRMRVLIAYEGSPGAAEAVTLVQAIPWPTESRIRIVTAVEPTLVAISGPGTGGAPLTDELNATITANANEMIRDVVELLEHSGSSVDGQVVRGRAASVIIDAARDFQPDLVIMGSRGHGAIASLLLGSVSSEVVDNAHCPVLVARRPTLHDILFATDGSASAQAAEAVLARWPIFADVSIRVVSVAEVIHPWTTGIAPTMYQQALDAYAADLQELKLAQERLAADAAARLGEVGRHVGAEMRVGDAAAEIIALAGQLDTDLIVLGSRGRTGLTRLVLGSVARNVLSAGNSSVLIVRDSIEEPLDSRP